MKLSLPWSARFGLFHAQNFIATYTDIWDVFITGPKGTGKTLLAFALADEFIRREWVAGVWSNVPHAYPRADSVANAFVILDESGQFMDNRFSHFSFDLYGMWARKSNTFYCFPSVVAIDNRSRNIQVIRMYDLDLIPGLRVWFYKYECEFMARKGWFGLLNPQHYFNTFATHEVPVHDGGTLESLVSMYPDAVRHIIEARSGQRLKRLLGIEKVKGTRSKGVSQAAYADLESRVEQLSEDFEELRQYVANIAGQQSSAGVPEASGRSFRNE